jgi:NAD(P)-dependent dehydrogenase (short-subunit alcohol dehydrogenase family)
MKTPRSMSAGTRRFVGQVALVTGAASGIGRATARRLAAEGAAVVVAYGRSRELGESLANELVASGADAIALRADVTSDTDVASLVADALDRFGQIDVLVNNAGEACFAPALSMTMAELDRMIDVNLKGTLRFIQAVAPVMVARRRGRIVNVASIAALGTSLLGTTPYAIAKAGVVQLTKRFALELGAEGITVNAVCPGATDTVMLRAGTGHALSEQEHLAAVRARTILGRIAGPEEIASVIAFLASDDAAFMTAQAIAVDGGFKEMLTHSA